MTIDNNNLKTKKDRIFFSLIASLSYLPILFFFSLPVFKKISFNPFGSLFTFILPVYRTAGHIYFVATLSSLMFAIILVFSVFFTLNKIDFSKLFTICHKLLFKYILFISPIILFYIILATSSLAEGGESGLGAVYAVIFIFEALFSILPILLFSLILYFWLKNQKKYSVIVYLFILIPLFFLGTKHFNKGCWPGDSVCMSEQALQNNNPDFCLKADDPGACFSYLAFITGNQSFCEQDSRMADFCYERVALKNKDVNQCGKLINKEVCYAKIYNEIAKETFDISLCDKAASYKWLHGESIINYGSCYAKTAINKNDISICDQLKEEKDKDGCYLDYAIDKKDCSLLKNPINKESCAKVVDYQTK
jgi:hypothetical protein